MRAVLGCYGCWRPHLVLAHGAGCYHGHIPLYISEDADATASRINAFLSGYPDKPLT
jgi:hypothetical protein